MSVLFTFPGQGAQQPGMLDALPDHPEVARTIAEAGVVLGHDALELDGAEALRSTAAVQLALLIAGVAAGRALVASARAPDLVAGLSIGAYPAAVIAGSLDFADALRLVALRGRLMEDAYPSGYGMTAIIGLPLRTVDALIARVHGPATPVFIANLNAPTQFVIAGSDAAMDGVAELARAAGATRCERLNMSVPSHCSLLDGVAAELEKAFAAVRVCNPACIYLSASLARPLSDPTRVAADLARNVARQVRWHDTARLAWERGARLAIEMPSGNVLTRLTREVFSDGTAIAVSESSLESAALLIDREG